MSAALLSSPSSIQDRTLEFQQCVNNFNRINKQQNHPQTIASNKNYNKSEFSSRASQIAKDIAHTTDLLAKLALIAKKKSFFDDRPIEIAELTYVIKQDIFKIEKSLKSLQQFINSSNNLSNETINRNNPPLSQISLYSKNVLNLLNSKFKNVSGEFKSVLEVRQQNEISSKNKKNQFLGHINNQNLLGPNNNNNNNNQPQIQNQNQNQNQIQKNGIIQNQSNNNKPSIASLQLGQSLISENPFLSSTLQDQENYSNSHNNDDFLTINDQSQTLTLLEEQNSQYLQERNRAVETIESTINEVGNLFQQLATMVQEQGESIQRIDQNVDDISLNIQGAHRELLKYYTSISNNKWLVFKIFAILIVFFLLWVLVS
ncbi:t-SNARE syntaxin [Ascoidea rubescens DSM 1968]|uniref:t-SNARE n=1 Tax=Ascoidea rubescens DSM 1968 TaxID=1344418 RepID=A0A1D2VC90_9ASCO|nr:t-SNARE [Ascoidea rubescens DSM 1968]ODV59229.1 t-SNARE [Ascoidea rubescens DSM 1968]